MSRRLGRRPPSNAPALMLGPHLTGTIPTHPVRVDYATEVPAWGMLANDQYGVCGPAAIAHQRMQISRYLTGTQQTPTVGDVFNLYRLCNPDFDPTTGAGDRGVVLQDLLGHVTRTGIAGTRAVAYAKVDHIRLDEIRAAIAVFGSLLFGVNLDQAQQTQTDNGGPWDYVPSPAWGGHAVLAVTYTSAASGSDIGVVTWGEVCGTTDRFAAHQLDECWAVLWPEHLGRREFLEGVDVAGLAADYEALTGRPFPVAPPTPVPPAPAPVPSPVIDQADRDLAAAVDAWAHLRHRGAAAVVASAFLNWKAAKRL